MKEYDLTLKQRSWIHELLHTYFNHVFSYYHKLPFSIIFKYLTFADKPFTLSNHLQYHDAADNTKNMQFDIPSLIDNPIFSVLFEEKDRKIIKLKIMKEKFNIFTYFAEKYLSDLIKKEADNFNAKFNKDFKDYLDKYTENIQELFLNNVVLKGYDYENETYDFSFEDMLSHDTTNACKAFQYFSDKIYKLYSFGKHENIKEKDIETLSSLFLDFLKEKIPFFKEILKGNNNYFESKDAKNPNIHPDEEKKGVLRTSFFKMVNYILEGKINGEIYNSDTEALLSKITAQSNVSCLLLREYNDDLPIYSHSIKENIRGIFSRLLKHLENPLLNDKFKYILEGVQGPKKQNNTVFKEGKDKSIKEMGKTHTMLWAMIELQKDPDNLPFLNEPEIKKIFTAKVKENLNEWKNKKPKSLDTPLSFDKDGNEKTRHDFEESRYNKIKISKEKEEDRIALCLENIRKYLDNIFPKEKEDIFVKTMMEDINTYLLNKRCFLQSKDAILLFELELTNHHLNELFKKYCNLCEIEIKKITEEIKKEFRKKMRVIFDYIKKEIRKLESRENTND